MPDDPPKEKHDHKTLKFPDGFLWGAATSAHQVEGNNVNSDWWEWELKNQPPQLRSGRAADQYHHFKQDFELAKKLNHNSHRLSIEWSRIEPKEGEFDQDAINHYLEVLKKLKELNLTVMLTLWHFTLPKWVADKGGWENRQTLSFYIRFLDKVVPLLKEYVDFWITVNEPSVYAYMAYLTGNWPPQKKNRLSAWKVTWNLASAHKRAYRLIKKVDRDAKVGMSQNVQSYEPYHKHSIREQLATMIGDGLTNHLFYILTRGSHDFLGINYYFHHRLKTNKGLLPEVIDISDDSRNVSDLGWEVHPQGIFDVLTDLSDHIPILITECGIASTNDDRRNRFLLEYLQEIYRAIQSGVRVEGFFYWSLLDNFEWDKGFDPRFGLVEVDYKTQVRTPRPSALVYADIIKNNGISHHLLRFLGHTIKAEEVLNYR